MSQGPLDHPAYLARQSVMLGTTTAGANGTTTFGNALPWDVNVHNLVGVVKTAGTSATTGNQLILLAGTATVGAVALGTQTAGSTNTSGDLKTKVTAGTVLYVKNGTDATGVGWLNVEYNIAPDTGTWVGGE